MNISDFYGNYHQKSEAFIVKHLNKKTQWVHPHAQAMKTRIFLYLCLLVFVGACEGIAPSQRVETSRETRLSSWLMQVLVWYEGKPEAAWLDLRWDKNEVPYMVGKQETVKWMRDSRFFTDRFLKAIESYLDDCEARGRNDLGMDHYGCLEVHVLANEWFDHYESVSDLSVEEKDGTQMVSFTLNGTIGEGTKNITQISQALRYRLVPLDSTWQIDQTGSIDEKGAWQRHWEY